jgi:hypothetical protein
MFQHDASDACAKVVLTGAYGVGLVAGTAVLIALTAPAPDHGQGRSDGLTHADVVMQASRERALVSPRAALVAGNESSERRDH